MFYDINDCDIASYADDNTPYASSIHVDPVMKETTGNNLLQKLRNIYMKENADKCLLLVTGNYESLGTLKKKNF